MSRVTEEILARCGSERRINYDLSRMLAALEAIGSPQKTVNSVIISGTNGKGSVTLLISAALARAGKRVTTYMSPHLQHVEERLLHNLEPIGELTLEALARNYEDVAKKFELSYFELMTLLYFAWVKELRPDVQVLEVGLGGRLDATNVTNPLACVLTNISWDHQSYLGNTLAEILDEKMGTFRRRVPVFSALQRELRPQLEARCIDLDIPLDFPDFLPREVESRGWDGQWVRIDGHRFFLRNPSPAALENATLAYLTLRMTFPEMSVETIQTAFAEVVNPGRLETVARAPRIVLSGDHNPAGVESLVETIEEFVSEPLHVVCAFSPDKPYREMFARLKQVATSVRLTAIPRLKDSLPPDYFTLSPYIEDPMQAIEAAARQAGPGGTVLVTGSLYLVGSVRSAWQSQVRYLATPPTLA